jgi:peroxin-11B
MASHVASVIKLTEKTSGRDKLCRVVQYGSKFLYWVLECGTLSPELVSKLKALESSISTARKCEAIKILYCVLRQSCC